jgi:hypothetical protein
VDEPLASPLAVFDAGRWGAEEGALGHCSTLIVVGLSTDRRVEDRTWSLWAEFGWDGFSRAKVKDGG